MRLVGDIGGTKTLLALADDAGTLHHLTRLAGDDYADFSSLLSAYFQQHSIDAKTLSNNCLAIAGPIADDGLSARLTNRPWLIDTPALAQQFGLGPTSLINDFAAAALGVSAVATTQLVTLQAGAPQADGVRLVLGAGTGLGVATLLPSAGSWRVLPGEGGHIGFAPLNEQQDELLVWLRKTHNRVTNEHLVSGMGLAAVHTFLNQQTMAPAEIAAKASAGDASALATFDLFASIYGAVAGDLALMLMARGGVFLAGGIAAQNITLMQRGSFIAAFNAKTPHVNLATCMPIHIVTEASLGLLGAAKNMILGLP